MPQDLGPAKGCRRGRRRSSSSGQRGRRAQLQLARGRRRTQARGRRGRCRATATPSFPSTHPLTPLRVPTTPCAPPLPSSSAVHTTQRRGQGPELAEGMGRMPWRGHASRRAAGRRLWRGRRRAAHGTGPAPSHATALPLPLNFLNPNTPSCQACLAPWWAVPTPLPPRHPFATPHPP